MAAANFFTVSSFGCFFLFPIFVMSHGGSKADIGIVMGATALSSVLCRPWISEMIDRVGRKQSYGIGCIMTSLLSLSYLMFRGELAEFYLPLLLVRLLHGVGLAICFTAGFTYIADIVPRERLNEGIGMFGVTALVGMAIGPVIAEIIIGEFGFQFFFLAAAGMAFIGFFLHLPLGESYDGRVSGSEMSFFSVLIRRKMLFVAVLALLFGFGLAASSNFVSPFAKEQHIAFISLYYIAYSSAAVITRFFGGRFADRVGEDRIIPYALIITGAGFLVLIALGGGHDTPRLGTHVRMWAWFSFSVPQCPCPSRRAERHPGQNKRHIYRRNRRGGVFRFHYFRMYWAMGWVSNPFFCRRYRLVCWIYDLPVETGSTLFRTYEKSIFPSRLT